MKIAITVLSMALFPTAANAQSGDWICPTSQQSSAMVSPSVLETMLPDYDNQYVSLWGFASGHVSRNQWTNEYTLTFFDREMESLTSMLQMHPDMVRSWLAYTKGDQVNGFAAKALVGVRGNTMMMLKLCAFNSNGRLAFETDEFSFKIPQ